MKEEVAKEPKVIEVREEATEKPKVVEVVEKPLKLEEEELEEEPEAIEVKEPETIATEPVEKKTVEEPVIEIKEEIDEELSEEMPLEEPEPTPKGPPIPSLLPYRGSLCPAGRSATLGRALLLEEDKNGGWWVSGRVGTEIPVGDPLTPGGGPGRAELRLKEEEEEEEETEEESKGITEERSKVVSEAPLSTTGGWELFGHLLVEDASRPGRVSVLRCVRCGAEAPLTDLKTLKKVPCKTAEAERREVAVSLPRKCENCGREAVASFCDSCADVFERYAISARPAPLRGRGGVKPPSVPGVDGWAWVSHVTTYFPFRNLEGEGREWWCPACKKTARRLVDAVDHFREAHPFEASRGWYEEFDVKSKRVRLRNWQGWVDEQQLQLILESEVKPQ